MLENISIQTLPKKFVNKELINETGKFDNKVKIEDTIVIPDKQTNPLFITFNSELFKVVFTFFFILI